MSLTLKSVSTLSVHAHARQAGFDGRHYFSTVRRRHHAYPQPPRRGGNSGWRPTLNVEDIEETPEGMLVTLRRSKTDQEGLGRRVAIPRGEIACPVAALRAWLDAAGVTEGAIFRRIFNKCSQ